jgi:hypothetical protein
MRTVIGGVVASVALAVTSVLATASPASAHYTIGKCGGPLWGMVFEQEVCVIAETRYKNPNDHTEWVGEVNVNHGVANSKLEIWGDGFYHVGYGEEATWWIDKRVRSGTNICGAVTDIHGSRVVTCLGIEV